jgi:2-iminobutanoate/2-iminopropanoate deaminase
MTTDTDPRVRMVKHTLAPRELPAAAGPFVPGVAVENCRLVWTSGVLARDSAGAIMGKGDVAAQTRQCIANLSQVLAAGGASLQDIIKLTVYLRDADPAQYAAMNAVRSELLRGASFASTTVQAGFFAQDALIEIEALAAIPLRG